MSTPTPRSRGRRSLGRGGAFSGGQAPAPAPEREPEAAADAGDAVDASAEEATAVGTAGPEGRPADDTAAETRPSAESDATAGGDTPEGRASDTAARATGTPSTPAAHSTASTTAITPGTSAAPDPATATGEGAGVGRSAPVTAVAAADDAGAVPSAAAVVAAEDVRSSAPTVARADGAGSGSSALAIAAADGVGAGPAEPPPGPVHHNGFAVRLDNFEGPFDLLLNLIAKHKLDVTEVSLSKVTDEFIAYIRAQGADWDLGVATEFLVVAATLLDLKAARLLPVAEIEDEEDLALLEARDLLFARLLQYRAYKEIAAILDERWAAEGRRYPRAVPLEERFTGMLPELVLDVDPEKFARLAARAMTPRSPKVVSIEHIHVQRVSVREQSAIVVERLRTHGALTFRALTADCPDNLHVIARFLCLLELFREAAVGFDQVEALGELHVRWTGGDEDAPEVGAEFDEQDGVDDGAEADGRTNTSGSGEAEERER